MRLTLQTDYALRLLMHLAVRTPELTTIAEVAAQYDISKNHLMKVAHTLGREEYIETVRGRGGGLRLARAPSEISVGDVTRMLEDCTALVECFPNGKGGCRLTPACKLKGILSEAMDALYAVLDGYTLHDLVARNSALRALLVEPV